MYPSLCVAMEFDSPETEKDFPGLYGSESARRSDSDYGDSGHEKSGGKKELLRNKNKDKSKDKGYAALGGDSSAEEMDLSDTKSPLKPKKMKSFKFLHKKEKEEKEEDKKEEKKDEKKKDKEDKKDDRKKKRKEKEKEKEERKREKEEKKKMKKDKKKKTDDDIEDAEDAPIFGVTLALAVERSPSHDGIRLPVVVRQCIDYVEEYGLHCEGIYRLSGVKSKVQNLRRQYNSGDPVNLDNQEPHVIASLLKQYLRELPEPVLTVEMMPHFEDVAMIPNPVERAEAMRQLIDRLPITNRFLVLYMFKHMGHIIDRQKETKMTYQNVSIVLSPTMQISHRVLNVLFLNHNYLFGSVTIKKYIPPIWSSGCDGTVEQLETVQDIEQEMMKQESLLGFLHAQVAAGNVSRKKEERLWEAQRIVTLLKRKLRNAQKREDNIGENKLFRREDFSMDQERESISEGSQKDMESSQEDDRHGTSEESSKFSSESEISQHSKKTSVSETNVTVVSVTVEPTIDISLDSLVFETDTTLSHATFPPPSHYQQTQNIIPVLPKPLSTRSDKIKLPHGTHDEMITKCDMSFERKSPAENCNEDHVDGAYSKMLEENGSNILPENQESHVTIIQVQGDVIEREPLIDRERTKGTDIEDRTKLEAEFDKGIKIEGFSETIWHKESNIYINQKSCQQVMQRPELMRLINNKTPLRETRSLDDFRLKGDEEYMNLLAEERLVDIEHEELLSMNHDMTRKLQAERAEIMRLKDEILEMQTLYGYRTYSYDSSESEGSESEGESDTEEEMVTELYGLQNSSTKLQNDNQILTRRIQEEREAVVRLRVKLQATSRILPPTQPLATTVY